MSELSDDNKNENITPVYNLSNTVIEEPKELPIDEDSCEEEHTDEEPSENNNITLYAISEENKKKRRNKKKKSEISIVI